MGTARSAETFEAADVAGGLRASVEGIKARGKAELGDKTLLDEHSIPSKSRSTPGPVRRGRGGAMAATACKAARRDRGSCRARRGRASYTGERSIGLGRRRRQLSPPLEALAKQWPKN